MSKIGYLLPVFPINIKRGMEHNSEHSAKFGATR